MVASEVAQACSEVAAAFDALERIDVAGLGDDGLHGFVMELHRFTSRLASLRAAPLAEWDARNLWADDGSKAPWARLAREAEMKPVTAKVEVGRAKKLRLMPVTALAFAEGKLTVDQVDLLCAAYQPPIATVFERDESMLVHELAGLRLPDGVRYIDYWIEHAFTEVDKERSRPDPAGRRWRVARTFDDHLDVNGWLDPIAGTEYETELRSIEREFFEADWAAVRSEHGDRALPSHLPRTSAQRMADAQVEMARRSRAFRQGKYRKPDPLITVHAGTGAFSQMCELANGTVVSPSQVFPLLLEADIERIVFDSPSHVIEVGVRERFFTGALRRALIARDRHCQHPSGCDVTAEECEGDHIIPYSEGGPTTQENGRMLCGGHNRGRNNDPNERPPPGAER